MATTIERSVGVRHPLEPLSVDEIATAVDVLRTERQLGERVRFVSISLHEPPKAAVLDLSSAGPIDRQAFAILLDNEVGSTYEAVVSLDRRAIVAWHELADVQPAIMLDEFLECEQACKASPEWQAAMRKRGITDFSLCMVDPWSAGNFGIAAEAGRRLSRALTWVRSRPDDNGYARPVENVITVVDLQAMNVLAVEDYGVVPLPPEDGNYSPAVAGTRTDLKPIEIHQSEGPSFVVDGHDVRWQKWHFRIGFTPREGLVLHTVSYEDQGRERPVVYRAAIADMLVPYGDPRPAYFRRNAFDVGEYGIGMLANSLEVGCDCLGEIHYFDVAGHDSRGQTMTIKNAICMHEEDSGLLWKHIDWRNGYTESRRSRRLVVSFIATVGNYEYGLYWYFYLDVSIQLEVKLTGIMSTRATHFRGVGQAPVGVLPQDAEVLLVHADGVLDGQGFAAAGAHGRVEITDEAEAIAAQLEAVGTHPHAVFADVEGVLAKVPAAGVSIGNDHLRHCRAVQYRPKPPAVLVADGIQYETLAGREADPQAPFLPPHLVALDRKARPL